MHAIVAALHQAGGTVRGRKVSCPFHSDRHASGGIYQGPDGRWRYKCFVCQWNRGRSVGTANDVLRAIGVDVSARNSLRTSRLIAPAADRPSLDFEAIWATYLDNDLVELAARLGVGLTAIRDMGYRRASRGVYGLRVYDSVGSVIGIQLRALRGKKWCIVGTRTGLFVPDKQPDAETLIVTEGASDATYALEVGFPALARFSAGLDPQHVAAWVKQSTYRTIVVMSDRDPAGLESGTRLAGAIKRIRGRMVKVLAAPGKDLRSWAPGAVAFRQIVRAALPL